MLHAQGLDDLVSSASGWRPRRAISRNGTRWWAASTNADRSVRIAMVGKYVELAESYKSLSEALVHAGIHTGTRVEIRYVDSEEIESARSRPPRRARTRCLVPGGFGKRGIEGKIRAVRYARRERRAVPRHLPGDAGRGDRVRAPLRGGSNGGPTARSSIPRRPATGHRAGYRMESGRTGRSSDRDEGSDLRGDDAPRRAAGPAAARVAEYARCTGTDVIGHERHRHRYEFNSTYMDPLQDAGLRIAGKTIDGTLVEVVEVPGHPWVHRMPIPSGVHPPPRADGPSAVQGVRRGGERLS